MENSPKLINLLWLLKHHYERYAGDPVDLKLLVTEPSYRQTVIKKAVQSKNNSLREIGLRARQFDTGIAHSTDLIDELTKKLQGTNTQTKTTKGAKGGGWSVGQDTELSELYDITSSEASLLQDSEYDSLLDRAEDYLTGKKIRRRAGRRLPGERSGMRFSLTGFTIALLLIGIIIFLFATRV